MKINRFGRAETLSPQEITLLFSEGFVKPRDGNENTAGIALYLEYACTPVST